jgi:hypothetical protein
VLSDQDAAALKQQIAESEQELSFDDVKPIEY